MISICRTCEYDKVPCKGNKDIEKTKCEFYKKCALDIDNAIFILNNSKISYGEKLLSYEEVKQQHAAIDLAIQGLRLLEENNFNKWNSTVSGNGWNEWEIQICPVCGNKFKHWATNFCPNCGKPLLK